jgi:hypothetical protein
MKSQGRDVMGSTCTFAETGRVILAVLMGGVIFHAQGCGDGGGNGKDVDVEVEDIVVGDDGDAADGSEDIIPEPICEPGESRCDEAEDNLLVCSADGTRWIEQDCALRCDPATSQCVNCEPAGYYRCEDDGNINRCNGHDWEIDMECWHGCQNVPETGEIQCLPSGIGNVAFPVEATGSIDNEAFIDPGDGTTVYAWLLLDTDTGEIRRCTAGADDHHVGETCTVYREGIMGDDPATGIYFYGTFMIRSMTLSGGKILGCIGTLPLRLFASGDAQVMGTIYVGAFYDETGVLRPGCGGNLPNEGAGRGAIGSEFAGGGGGAYGGAGGSGTGSGGPSAGGAPYGGANLNPLFGGSGGGSGDAAGGPSGGALELVSLTYINISGRIYAGGGPGFGGTKPYGSDDDGGSGGGGGSGGAVLIEGKRVDVNGVITCAGGSGGGGIHVTDYWGSGHGGDGEFAPIVDWSQATGGTAGPDGCRGGFGSGFMGDVESTAGESVDCAATGGGGGGGGCGRIRINSENTVVGSQFHPSIESGLTTMNHEIHFKDLDL